MLREKREEREKWEGKSGKGKEKSGKGKVRSGVLGWFSGFGAAEFFVFVACSLLALADLTA